MHDPLTVAFDIRLPLPWKTPCRLKSGRGENEWATYHLATIWHHDPELDGTDDSCGWFPRTRHGDKAVLEKIIKHFEYDWDRVFTSEGTGNTYFCGYFRPDGKPNLSVSAIVLNLFFIAAGEHFKSDGLSYWERSKRFMRRNLFDILMFAENPTDSMFDGITMKFGTDGYPSGNEFKDARHRNERIKCTAACVYAWILRAERPWYRHPRWHIHHLRLQVPFLQQLYRFLFVHCSKCGKGFRWNESVIGSWSGNKIWHGRCDHEH